MKYAYSLKTERVKEPDFPYHNEKITRAEDVFNFVRKLQDSDIEKLITLYLDAQNKIICVQIQTGTINQAAPYPREIFKHALLCSAVGIALVHNHPSNNITASPEDKSFTFKIKEAAKLFDIKFLDHVIIGEDQFLSFQEAGLL
jgi:DNA repair protein RadC